MESSMASIINQSRYVVRVKRRPDLKREFPHTKKAEALAYQGRLINLDNLPATIEQLSNQLLVRIRRLGYPEQCIKAASFEEAEKIELNLAAQQSCSLFIDYSRARSVTLAELITRYINEECLTKHCHEKQRIEGESHKHKSDCFKHKSAMVELYTLQSFLADSRHELANAIKECLRAKDSGKAFPTIKAMREPRTSLEWLHLPFSEVMPTHIEDFIRDRLEQVMPATVDRELDRLSAVINLAMKTWRYDLHRSPMLGVRRPKYFNERNRTLKGDEQERLFRSARREDLIRSRELALENLLAPAREKAKRARNASARQRYLRRARKIALKKLNRRYEIIPLYEAFISFQLETAARRGEALALKWTDVSLGDQTAHFPETKNSLPRTVPVQRFTADLLALLPRAGVYVFPISHGSLKGAWNRICERAGLRERDRTNELKCLNDFHLHDARHSALTKIAEAGHGTEGKPFTLIDLQAISGHRDLRMLARYAHLCAKHLAKRLDAVFADAGVKLDGGHRSGHKGRRRLGGKEGLTVREVIAAPPDAPAVESTRAQPPDSSDALKLTLTTTSPTAIAETDEV
jgi:integrase